MAMFRWKHPRNTSALSVVCASSLGAAATTTRSRFTLIINNKRNLCSSYTPFACRPHDKIPLQCSYVCHRSNRLQFVVNYPPNAQAVRVRAFPAEPAHPTLHTLSPHNSKTEANATIPVVEITATPRDARRSGAPTSQVQCNATPTLA